VKIFPDLARVRGHTIWTKQLVPGSVVVDAGAHQGEFSREMKERFGCVCWPVEANPRLAARLRDDGFANTIPAALGASDGKTCFIFRDNSESSSVIPREMDTLADAVEVATITLPTLMQRAGLAWIDLLKLDIEGAEFDLLESTPDYVLRSIGQITVEFHDFFPEFRGRGLFNRVRERLAALGFACWPMAFRTNGDVLVLNLRSSGLGAFRCWKHAVFGRWVMKLRGE